MSYTWPGMRKMTIQEVIDRFEAGELEGCFYLYDDETEAMIDGNATLEEISNQLARGVEIGEEV